MLARDRLGEKPLYYAFLDDGRLIFASELKSVICCPEVERRLDPLAVEEYFALGYVPDPRSIYLSVRKLSPGHFLLLRRGEVPLAPRCYWRLRFADNVLGVAHLLEKAAEMKRVEQTKAHAFLVPCPLHNLSQLKHLALRPKCAHHA